MFIPLHDANNLKHIDRQYVTLALIGLNVAIYLGVNLGLIEGVYEAAVFSFGYIPAVVGGTAVLPPDSVYIPEELSLISHSFLHGDIIHLATNMMFLWVFGDNVEDALGHMRFLVFYLLCAVAGALAHGLLQPESVAPLIGASGAVSGIIGAYLILHPKVWIWVLVFGRIPLRLPAVVPLLFWIAYQVGAIFLFSEDDISWGAHVGGVAAGILLVVLMKRRGVPLFDREIISPDAVQVVAPNPSAPPPNLSKSGPWGRG